MPSSRASASATSSDRRHGGIGCLPRPGIRNPPAATRGTRCVGSEARASSTWRATKERGSRAPWSEGPSAGPIKGRSGNVGPPDRLLAGRDQGQVRGATRHRCLRLPQRDEQGAHDGEAVTFPVSATGVEPFPARRVGVSGPALKRLPSAPHPPKPNRSLT